MSQQDDRLGLPSASSGERFFNCPGSVALEAQAPPETPTDEAQQGTEIHAAMESEDFTGLDDEGRTIAEKLSGFEKHITTRFVQETQQTPSVLREERMWFKDEKNKPACSAKPDVALIGKTHAASLDFKTGYLKVTPAYRNIQMRIQALALWSEYPRIAVIQTGIAAYRFRGSLDIVTYDIPALETAKRELLFNLWRTKQPDAPRNPGPWCRYCKAAQAAMCPEFATASMLSLVHTGPAPMKKADVIAKAQTLDTPQLAFIHERIPMLRNFADAVVDRLKGLPPEELASVGLQKVPGGNVRTIPDPQAMWGALFFEKLLTLEEFQSCLKAVVTLVEDKLVEKIQARDGGTKKHALALAQKLMEPAIALVPKAQMLKPLKADKALPEGE